ncbi:hypothetical protein FGG69_gp03 [Salinibacter phage SRUTV-1]|uniref:Uncharacterized protein n=1 Tax=Salinibacter phage SRUTV-1 TaxID=2684227 RepID=A0A2D3FAJ0_9CAUD|nr:hypothetical protein FGG69_gp03 [Salinibacter phage SRUTV-1]ATU47032.1 hypothetical protein [Salinibacter phage SRUTV-1]
MRYLAIEKDFHDAELLGIEPRPENGKSAARDLYIRVGDEIVAITLFPPGQYEELNSVQWDRVEFGDIGPYRIDGRPDRSSMTVHGIGSVEVNHKHHNGHGWTEVVIDSPDDPDDSVYSWESMTFTIHH